MATVTPMDFMSISTHRLEILFLLQLDIELNATVGPPLSLVMRNFGCDPLACDINVFALALALPLTQEVLPPMDQLADYWVPWDYRLRGNQQVRILITDLQLFHTFRLYSGQQLQDHIDLRPPRPRVRGPAYHQTMVLTLTYFPHTDTIYRIATLSDGMSRLEIQVAKIQDHLRRLEEQLRLLSSNLSICIETLCANNESLVPLFQAWHLRDHQ